MNKTSTLVMILFSLASLSNANAGELPTASPGAVKMSADKLGKVVPRMQRMVDKGRLSGAITIVSRNGKVVLFEAVGKRELKGEKPMTRDTIMRIYSMTKPLTSVAAMMLVEEGKLSLDDPLEKYLPSIRDVKVFVEVKDGETVLTEPKQKVTIRDLMRHTSGLTYGFFGDSEVDKRYQRADVLARSGDLQLMMKKLAQLPLAHQPGTRFEYSVSTDVLGRVVEVASGEAFDDFLSKRILQPLDMKDTGFFVPDEKLDRFAANYGPQVGGGLRVIDDPQESRYRRDPSMLSGGGGLVSTARDYMRFCQMLLNKGEFEGKRLLKAASVEAMTRNQLPADAYPIQLNGERPGVGFGLGFSVIVEKTEYTKRCRVGEYGWGGAASTHFWISPRDNLAVVVLTQFMPFTFQAEDAIKPLVYDAVQDAPAKPK